MRITQAQLQAFALNAITDSRIELQHSQEVAATGVLIDTPSDDPATATRARLIHSLMEESGRHESNIADGRLRLQRIEQALTESGNLLLRAKELAYAMANETMSQDQRALAATEVQELHNSLVDLANTKAGKEYIFASVATTSAPLDAAGTFTYDVNLYQSVREVEIGPSALGEIGSSASVAFAQRAIDPNSVDVFQTLRDLTTALNTNDPDAIRTSIDDLESAFDQVLAERSRVGVRNGRLDTAENAAEQTYQLYQSLESELVDADAAEAFSSLAMAETALQASISVASRVLGPSLLDHM